MSSKLAYCPNLDSILSRLKIFYEERSQDIILAKMAPPNQTLLDFASKHNEGPCGYPNIGERILFWDNYLKERARIHDDSIPSAFLTELDQGLYGGVLGGDVRFMCNPKIGHISSMVPPLLETWSEFDKLSFRTDSDWFHRYTEQMDIFVKHAEGKFGISHFILINGLNFVFELIGATQTYLDLQERPDMIYRAFEMAFEINTKIHKTFFEKVPLVDGGTFSNFAQWIPGRVISESLDPFHMTSVEYFEKWGREPAERIFSCFDGGIIHIHGNGRHLLEAAVTLRGLKAIFLADDTPPPPFEVLSEIKKKTGSIPLICPVEFSEFYKKLKKNQIIGGVMYIINNVPDVETANRYMDIIRDRR